MTFGVAIITFFVVRGATCMRMCVSTSLTADAGCA